MTNAKRNEISWHKHHSVQLQAAAAKTDPAELSPHFSASVVLASYRRYVV